MRLSEEKITRGNAVAVKAAVLASAQAGDTVLDFSNVKSVDSTSVSILMSWVRTLQSLQRTPEIRCVPGKNALSDAALRCERSACAVLQVRQKKKFLKPP